jgi:hypothetical protein
MVVRRPRLSAFPPLLVLICALAPAYAAFAHDPRLDLPEPQSVPEAWDVLRESTQNVAKLLELGQLPDEAYQIANTSPALRLLEAHARETSDPAKLTDTTRRVLTTGFDVILATREPLGPLAHAREKWQEYQNAFKDLETFYPAEVRSAAVYICPMHPKDRHLKPDEKCTLCRMALVRRRIPASTVYETPGQPSMKLAVACEPLVAGREAQVRITLTQAADGSPVTLDDLVEMHTKKIHLLINNAALSDYHHEHPTPTGKPGEYAFKFTPAAPGPYRVWADVVPASTSIQEYVIADFPSSALGAGLTDKEDVLSAVVNGRKYDLTLYNNGQPIRTGDTVTGTIAVTGEDGKPFTKLEPIMGTYAHIVAFGEDGKTVIHVHPYGQEPTKPEDRGGPAFGFKFYAPAPGFYRLYGQVQIGGESQFPPFGLTVLPAAKATDR